MFTDYSQSMQPNNGVIVFPEYAFVPEPKDAADILETSQIVGTGSLTSISLTGSADSL